MTALLSPLRAGDTEIACCFPQLHCVSDLDIGTPVATLPGVVPGIAVSVTGLVHQVSEYC